MTQLRPEFITFSEIVKVVANYYAGTDIQPYRKVAKLLYELEYDWPPDYSPKNFVQRNKRVVKALFDAIPPKRYYRGKK